MMDQLENKIKGKDVSDSDKILSSLKIKFKQTNFNKEDDFKRHLEKSFRIDTDNKIIKTLIKKTGIKITGIVKEKNKVNKINGIKKN